MERHKPASSITVGSEFFHHVLSVIPRTICDHSETCLSVTSWSNNEKYDFVRLLKTSASCSRLHLRTHTATLLCFTHENDGSDWAGKVASSCALRLHRQASGFLDRLWTVWCTFCNDGSHLVFLVACFPRFCRREYLSQGSELSNVPRNERCTQRSENECEMVVPQVVGNSVYVWFAMELQSFAVWSVVLLLMMMMSRFRVWWYKRFTCQCHK